MQSPTASNVFQFPAERQLQAFERLSATMTSEDLLLHRLHTVQSLSDDIDRLESELERVLSMPDIERRVSDDAVLHAQVAILNLRLALNKMAL